MSNSPMIPLFAPDGTLGEVPFEKLHDAISAGGTIARKMQAPTGEVGYIPANRANEAVKAGGKVLPYDAMDSHLGEINWEGSKAAALDTLKNQAKSLISPQNFAANAIDPGGIGRGTMNAVNEAVAGWKRANDPRAKVGEAFLSAIASPFVSAEAQAEHAAKGESNKIVGETAVPALETAAAYGMAEGTRVLSGEPLANLRSFLKDKLFSEDGRMTPLGKSLAHPVESAAEYGLRRAVGAADVEQKGASVPITKSPNFNPAEYKAGKAGRFQTESPAGTTIKPGGLIVDPNSPPPDVKVTYQSIPGPHLLEKVMGGDLDAIGEWQRRGLPLPENVKFLVEKGSTKPWRNLEK